MSLIYPRRIPVTYLHDTQGSVAPGELCRLMFPQSMTKTEHKDTTVESVSSVESVHVNPAETGPRVLSALTHRDILGTCYAGL